MFPISSRRFLSNLVTGIDLLRGIHRNREILDQSIFLSVDNKVNFVHNDNLYFEYTPLLTVHEASLCLVRRTP